MINNFSSAVLKWYKENGRANLPWKNKDPYKIWISEIMLQQTQVKTVIPYYSKFIKKYPTLERLSTAKYDELMLLWSGLGYYRRLDNIYKSVRIIMNKHSGVFPNNYDDILSLPGIGRTTASAIYTFSEFGSKAILDGNVKRIILRFFNISKNIKKSHLEESLWSKSTLLTPLGKNTSNFIQGMMDIGSIICTRGKPNCGICPLKKIGCKFKYNKIDEKKVIKTILHKKTYLAILVDSHKKIFLEKIQDGSLWKNLYSSPSFNTKEKEEMWISKNNLSTIKKPEQISISHRVTNKLYKFIATFYFLKSNKKVSLSRHNWYNLSNINVGIPKYQEKIINLYFNKNGEDILLKTKQRA